MTERALEEFDAVATKRPVLVAYTDDSAGTAVLRAAAEEATLRHTSVTLVHQLVGPEAPEVFGSQVESNAMRHRVEQRILDTAHEIAPTVEIDVQVIAHSVIPHLVVASLSAELLVAGATFAHATTAALVEAMPRELGRRANCPVLLVPATAAGRPISQVVCGIDRSPESEAALSWASIEAALRGTTLLAVEVHKGPSEAEPRDLGAADSLTRWVRERAPAAATTVLCATERGKPAGRLLDIAAETNGLLVIGMHHHHQNTGLWPRSVARTVMSQTRVPVVLVPTRALHDASDWPDSNGNGNDELATQS